MKFIEVETKNRTADFINRLLTVWESSVRATHLFLSDSEIKKIKEYVPQALIGIAQLMIAEDVWGWPVAFMGIEATGHAVSSCAISNGTSPVSACGT